MSNMKLKEVYFCIVFLDVFWLHFGGHSVLRAQNQELQDNEYAPIVLFIATFLLFLSDGNRGSVRTVSKLRRKTYHVSANLLGPVWEMSRKSDMRVCQ